MKTEKSYCGIDVSSETLDICYQTLEGEKHHLQVPNTKKCFAEILKTCPKTTHFLMESTGVYHMQLMFYLHGKKRSYTIVNALQIKRYIQMHLERNKSDKKDAKRICEYGIDRNPEPSQMPESSYFECRMLNQAIHDMTKSITKLSNQIHSLKRSGIEEETVVKSYQTVMRKLKQEQEKLSSKLEEKLKS